MLGLPLIPGEVTPRDQSLSGSAWAGSYSSVGTDTGSALQPMAGSLEPLWDRDCVEVSGEAARRSDIARHRLQTEIANDAPQGINRRAIGADIERPFPGKGLSLSVFGSSDQR